MPKTRNILQYLSSVIIILIVSGLLLSQKMPEDKDKYQFRSPFDFQLLLSGTFAELRSNHFHSGIDIKTGGVEGKPVYAVMDGYVTRIKVSPYGYGKALYIDHPGGFTSVYGHLRNYNDEIGKWVKNEQYRRESFDFDANLHPGQILVKKGDVIAYSGNSGGSGGPHLHFEIRDAASQQALNPLRYGFGEYVKDYIRPTIQRLKIYPLSENATINGTNKSMLNIVKGWGENHRIEPADTILVSGKIGFGIQAYDLLNNASNHNGIMALELWLDDYLIFSYNFDRLSFDETRYINSLVDYEEYVRYKRWIQKSFLEPYNKLSVYTKSSLNGIVNFNKNGKHTVTYVLKDHFDNESRLSFPLKSSEPLVSKANVEKKISTETVWFYPGQANVFISGDVKVELPPGVLYDTLLFRCTVESKKRSDYSEAFSIHNYYTPAHKHFEVSIRPDSLPAALQSKALLVNFSSKGRWGSAGGRYENGWVKARVREFGDYRVAVDTIPPKIKALNIYSGKKIAQANISFEISDNLAGIDNYRGEINGKWILMEYDPKRNLLFYAVDDKLPAGKSVFTLAVKDGKGNVTKYTANILH